MAGLRRALLGYSSSSVASVLADREHMFDLVSKEARSATERADRLASELWETQRRVGEAEMRLTSSQELGGTLAADLERSVAEREAMEAKLIVLREEMTGVSGALTVANAAIEIRDRELRQAAERATALEDQLAERTRGRAEVEEQLQSARSVSASLQENLRERNERLATAEAEASKAQVWLRRALEESADYKAELASEQARRGELEDLLATYRDELGERSAAGADTPSAPDAPSSARELAAVLQVTEEAVVRIMESTRARADQELRTVDRDRERIAREVEAMKTWRDRAAPVITRMQTTLEEMTGLATGIGTRIDEALRPVTGVVTRLSSELSALDALSTATPAPATGTDQREDSARVIELHDDRTAGRDAWREQ